MVRSRRGYLNRLEADPMAFDMILCGFNTTRVMINETVRNARGFTKPDPFPGEKIMILTNNRELGLFNGQILEVMDVRRATTQKEVMQMDLMDPDVADDDDTQRKHWQSINVWEKQFGVAKRIETDRQKSDWLYQNKIVTADFAYAQTGHKALGSEYPKVLVVEEIGQRWNKARWRYTTATRQQEFLEYLIR